ncbi:uncharacterized protein LACBIDRAFT_316310 [Laccaria bicolor S238N-H82]|uniref:Predicted protein n=1 Tax=Laccaria bicolor (strain S238N-H82 / ATCC MYA-4686) TaxID=486041 RepID=B0E0P3_LACBS|nr:uncharacterized protein LACBIDRAFT_316310 [Laccaria bicolor S238N-H82]EDQ99622.1 predicted protein [Laccaria bicolor S238N-H82]|eukprot:XP_001889733.1 predicted protein [Laccaria bicolor S238N-H82]
MPGLEDVDASDEEDEEDEEGEVEETDEAELERLIEEWTSPVYAFFQPIPDITYDAKGRRAHEFRCATAVCKCKGANVRMVRCYLDTTDRKSTRNLKCHATGCWEAETIDSALEVKVDICSACATLGNLKDGSIMAAFERKGKGKITYSHRQHTKPETCVEIVRWVAESMRPFSIVEDHGFRCLMKTGRPEYYLPSHSTIS